MEWVLEEFERRPKLPFSRMVMPVVLFLLHRPDEAEDAIRAVEQGGWTRLPPQFATFAAALRRLIESGEDTGS